MKEYPLAADYKGQQASSDPNVELDISAGGGEHGKALKFMLLELQTLKWERVACYIPDLPGLAHFLIVNQPQVLPGADIVQYFVDNFNS